MSDKNRSVAGKVVAGLVAELVAARARCEALEAEIVREQHDDLTGALMRRRFNVDVDELIETASKDPGTIFHASFFDVRLMKVLNDTLGHPVTDLLLKSIGEAGNEIQNTDARFVFGRFGGDEFVLFVAGGTTAEARELSNKLKDRAFELFSEKVANNWKSFHPGMDAPRKTPKAVNAVASRWFGLTTGVSSAPADPNFTPSEIREYLVEKSDDQMMRVKDLQKVFSYKDLINAQIDLAEAAGIKITPSFEWLKNNARSNSRAEREFRTDLDSYTRLALKAGARALASREPWMLELFGEPPLVESRVSREARLMDVAYVAALRTHFDVIDPHVILPEEVLDRDMSAYAVLSAVGDYDYGNPKKLSASGFGVSDPSQKEAGWESILDGPVDPDRPSVIEDEFVGVQRNGVGPPMVQYELELG